MSSKQTENNVFSLHETKKPKFLDSQIRITDEKKCSSPAKQIFVNKLKVGRTGKIGYSK